MLWIEMRTLLAIGLLILLPGWALLSCGGYCRRWQALQRWMIAASLGIAFWAVLYYLCRALLPSVLLGLNKILLILLVSALLIIIFLRDSIREQFAFGEHAGLVLVILGITLATRLLLAHRFPYPAWTDSLHHSLLTESLARWGVLPTTMQGFDSALLDGYHLGLYALTAPVTLLARVPAHTALIWTAQVLNGLCAIGVFLLLDRWVSRPAGIVGLAVAGLFCFQPALYFGWGRFTQLGAQVLLLPAVLLCLEALKPDKNENRKEMAYAIGLAALLCAGMALIHFRVAVFGFALLLLSCLWLIFAQSHSKKEGLKVFARLALLGLAVLLLILPAFLPAIRSYLSPAQPLATSAGGDSSMDASAYFEGFTWETFWVVGIQKWLALLAVACGVLALFSKKTRAFSVITFVWILLLAGMGFLYKLPIAKLAFTNMTGIMILAYLPAGLLIGLGLEALLGLLKDFRPMGELALILCLIVLCVPAAEKRVSEVELWRQFISPADVTAMDWLRDNTPQDAVFAVNTYRWFSTAVHGSDAGYYLPYFADRHTTTGLMISNLGPDHAHLLKLSAEVMQLYEDPASVSRLCAQGVSYLYSGAKAPFTGQDFDLDALLAQKGVRLLYDREGVQVLSLCAEEQP